ncbi:hypothetical protein SPF06_04700 [Sinomonas sp. JGH33]|uniref:Uncharacterized protein n=1 Tax=Sinomonas terricola TaxID=3110330 RepID=A0ABU5T3A9_9MICC|nr:hypothetical protein [Sinomonas sp. JGH33]MEA5454017.1 hypothetical protein [Sinomonas sp. JGH33]
MEEPSQAIVDQLDAAARAAQTTAGASPSSASPPSGPPGPGTAPAKRATTAAAPAGAGGSATTHYLVLDHYFSGGPAALWAYDGAAWRAGLVAEPGDEQGVVQVAFAANRVDVWWDSSGSLSVIRSWKYL